MQVFDNPFTGLNPAHRGRRLLSVHNENDIHTLLATPDTSTDRGIRTRALLEVAYSTGARLEELCRMRPCDMDLANGTVRILGKGNRERVVPMGRVALEWVLKYLRDVIPSRAQNYAGALWIKSDGTALGSQGIAISIKKCSRKAGIQIPVTPHGIRRACATHMLACGAHPLQIQMLLGHSTLSHLNHYLRVATREIKDVHERSCLGQ